MPLISAPQALGERHTATLDAHQGNVLAAVILLDNFVGQANEGALDLGSRHQA